MAATQQDLDNINAAISSGELEVMANGRKVTYRSIDQLLLARGVIEADLAGQAAAASSTRRSSYHFNFATMRER